MLSSVKVRIAVAPGPGTLERASLIDLVDGLEAREFDTIWLSDVPLAPTTDPLVALSFAAGRTERLKLGANVVPIGRNPILLAKALAQLDQLSAGRLLLSFVPGLDQRGEREALGIGPRERGSYLEEVIPLIRRWWAGETIEHHSARFTFPDIKVRPLPVQQPLEIWLGGIGPAALDRVGRLADGWLGAAVSATEAGAARARIDAAARAAGRTIDPEHHGLSIPYAHAKPDPATVAAIQARRPDADVADLLPVGRSALRGLLGQLVDQGLSKFVLRPTTTVTSWTDELDWLADAVLDLQA